MKRLTVILLSALMLMIVGTANAQTDFSMTWNQSGNNGSYEMGHNMGYKHDTYIIQQIWDIVDIDTIRMVYADANGFPHTITDPETWWTNGRFTIQTLDGRVDLNLSDFVDGYYTTTIENVFAISFKFDAWLDEPTGQYARTFFCEVRASNLVSGDVISELEDSIYALNTAIEAYELDIVPAAYEEGFENGYNAGVESSNVIINELEDSIYTLNTAIEAYELDIVPAAYEEGFENGYDAGWESGFQAGLDSCDQTSIIPPVNSTNNEVNVYPNPVKTNQTLHIQSENLDKVEVYTVSGMKIKTDFINELDVSDLQSGMYIVKVYDMNDNVSVSRFMVSE